MLNINLIFCLNDRIIDQVCLCVHVHNMQLVSASKIATPTSAIVEEIVTATPEGSSIVSAGVDVTDGNALSGKIKNIENSNKLAARKDKHNQKSKSVDNAELAEVHQSPAKSSDGSSSTTSSTWSVKISPIKKRFSLSNKIKRSASVSSAPNVSLESEEIEPEKKDQEKEGVLPADKNVVLVKFGIFVECISVNFYVLLVT